MSGTTNAAASPYRGSDKLAIPRVAASGIRKLRRWQ
jgi:hypothetical protein